MSHLVASILFLFLIQHSLSCGKDHAAPPDMLFDSIPLVKQVFPIINETSGIADSKKNPGFIWAHEDSGNPTQIYLVNHNGNVTKKIHLKGITNRDWEDMVLCNDEIYIGDIGDNNEVYTDYTIYKFPEPLFLTDTVSTMEVIKFQYPDGSHDAEAFLVDPVTKNIFIITKRDNSSKVYLLSYPYAAMNAVRLVHSLPYGGVTSAAIKNDGKEIIIKTYGNLYYYTRSSNELVEQSLQKNFKTLPYNAEPQGEAICFANDASGFYTMSEKGFATSVNLFYYKRK